MTLTELWDPFDPETIAYPYEAYRRLRDDDPVHYNPRRDIWAVSRFEDVLDVLHRPEEFISGKGITIDHDAPAMLPMLVQLDAPRHDELRALVSRAFTPARIAAQEPRARHLARTALDSVEPGRPLDLVEALADPLPTIMIADLLGVPSADQAQFKEWVSQSNSATPDDPASADRTMVALISIAEYVSAFISSRKDSDGDDLISKLLVAEVDGQRLSDEEILGFCLLLLLAGSDTTSGLIGTSLINLHLNPDQRRHLVEDPGRIGGAVDELVRFGGSVQGLARTTSRDAAVRGVTIPEGSKVVVLFAAANRDEREFEQADSLRLDRDLKRHVGFGHGLHYCLGAALARLQTRVVLEELLERSPEYDVDHESVAWYHSALTRGPSSLTITL